MGGQKKVTPNLQTGKDAHKTNLNQLLDFGPDTESLVSVESQDTTQRLKQMVKKLQELTQRVDALNNKF